MSTETLVVARAPFDIEEPWDTPKGCTPFRLLRATDAATPRLATSVGAWYDDDYLSVVFSASDDHVAATHFRHDAPLYEEDVVELFLAPERAREYYELEVNPVGTVFDARIHSPDGVRATMTTDLEWTCEGLIAAVRKIVGSHGAISIDTLLRIPFAALERKSPRSGETWRANFFRIDRHPQHGDELSAWQPTLRVPADFHVPDLFGTLRFE